MRPSRDDAGLFPGIKGFSTLHAFEKSAGKLGVDQIDLLILHQALPSAFDRTLEIPEA